MPEPSFCSVCGDITDFEYLFQGVWRCMLCGHKKRDKGERQPWKRMKT